MWQAEKYWDKLAEEQAARELYDKIEEEEDDEPALRRPKDGRRKKKRSKKVSFNHAAGMVGTPGHAVQTWHALCPEHCSSQVCLIKNVHVSLCCTVSLHAIRYIVADDSSVVRNHLCPMMCTISRTACVDWCMHASAHVVTICIVCMLTAQSNA